MNTFRRKTRNEAIDELIKINRFLRESLRIEDLGTSTTTGGHSLHESCPDDIRLAWNRLALLDYEAIGRTKSDAFTHMVNASNNAKGASHRKIDVLARDPGSCRKVSQSNSYYEGIQSHWFIPDTDKAMVICANSRFLLGHYRKGTFTWNEYLGYRKQLWTAIKDWYQDDSHHMWEDVIKAMDKIENSVNNKMSRQSDPTEETPFEKYRQDLIQKATTYSWEVENGTSHVLKWKRMLAALGEDNGETPMELREIENWETNPRWGPMVHFLKHRDDPLNLEIKKDDLVHGIQEDEEDTLEFKMNRLIGDMENSLISKTGRFGWSFSGLMNLCTETLDFVEQGHDIDLQHFTAWRLKIFSVLDDHGESDRKKQIAKVLNPLVMFHSNPDMRENLGEDKHTEWIEKTDLSIVTTPRIRELLKTKAWNLETSKKIYATYIE